MKWRKRTLDDIAEMICGGVDNPFRYRSSSYITRFFQDADLPYAHDGSTRSWWVSNTLEKVLAEPHPNSATPPAALSRVIHVLMDLGDATPSDPERKMALTMLNNALQREGFEAFYANNKQCYLRHLGTGTVADTMANPHRPFTQAEIEKRELLSAYLDKTSEDDLIGEVLLPLFRQLGFHRISSSGHKDKALEYGKDIWMRYTLPTQHVLYFGVQVKRDKLDAAGMGKPGNANIGEILNQVRMMLGHEIFDPESSRKVLVDHAFIVAGGEITKAARNWLGSKLDNQKRSQVMFMERDDILNLYAVTSLPLPVGARPKTSSILDDEVPF
jgi:hypothetical protein